MDIQIDGVETRAVSTNILVMVSALRNNVERLNSILDNLSNAWESDAATSYINTMREQNITQLRKLCEVLEEYGNYLYHVPNIYSTLDEIFSAKGFDF